MASSTSFSPSHLAPTRAVSSPLFSSKLNPSRVSFPSRTRILKLAYDAPLLNLKVLSAHEPKGFLFVGQRMMVGFQFSHRNPGGH
ncbi:hypothetical protein SLEP1_g32434 [Rubroshorea leprosula]|uniref:Uncharacterized protein n=1 Tax=Rubroshorea leprosula TaxID=152421 RepID=A0AAV5KDD6_9ROSI|nr:hypothetical protein SLEP1_g32434 [Rubroshorea leprosula]